MCGKKTLKECKVIAVLPYLAKYTLLHIYQILFIKSPLLYLLLTKIDLKIHITFEHPTICHQ